MALEFTKKDHVDRYAEGVTAEELSLRPVMLKLVGDVRMKHVLDIGCGDGRYSLIFANSGALVVATDFSIHQIEIAQKKHAHRNIQYSVGDVSADTVAPASMDVIFANLVVPSLGSPEKLNELFSLAKSMLKHDGRFVFSTLHPLYLSPNQDSYDKATDFSPVNYFNEGSLFRSEAQTNAGNKMVFEEAHFSLSRISRCLMENGFLIRSIVESKQVPDKGMLLPKYLAFECVLTKGE
jgi:cyclopropane fatty-acyl-phospholipid synthase-like methyltransferase